MYLVGKYNNINKTKLFLVLLVISVFTDTVNIAGAETLTVTGKFVRGTCTVVEPEQNVLFPGAVLISDLKNSNKDKTYTADFVFKYNCQDFDSSLGPGNMQIKISPSSGTVINTDNIIYPASNVLNAGFVLNYCDKNNSDCKPVQFSPEGIIPFQVIENGDIESYFKVSVVRLSEQPAKTGELVASVDLTLVHP